jgi:hypothetical protein
MPWQSAGRRPLTCASGLGARGSRLPLSRILFVILDERLAFLRTVAAIGGWAPLLEIDALRILPAEAEAFVGSLVADRLIEHDVVEHTVRLTIEGLKRVALAMPQMRAYRRGAYRG